MVCRAQVRTGLGKSDRPGSQGGFEKRGQPRLRRSGARTQFRARQPHARIERGMGKRICPADTAPLTTNEWHQRAHALTAAGEEPTVAPERVGAFRFYFDDQRWEWSEQVQRMHGYQPGTVTPTTELVLSHKHPDDRDQIAQTIDNIRRTGQPLSSRHRIIDTSGKVRSVVVVGDELRDERGRVVGTHGFYIDATPDEREQQDLVTAQLAVIAENRAVIEQAKGVLMAAYGITGVRAFEIL